MSAIGKGTAKQRPRVATTLDIHAETALKGTVQDTSKPVSSLHQGGKQLSPPWDDLGNMALLVLLYAMQGIPLGLTTGAMPFMLGAKLSMTQMGVFSIAAYPYSFKLLWSPLVDGLYLGALGRRKTWLLPTQLAMGALLVGSSEWMGARYDAADVTGLTALFFVLVLLAATQDIAVDGWALTLLKPHNLAYASTSQTLGMNLGYFTSFTLFLALSNPQFCNAYVRTNPLVAALLPGLAGPASDSGLVTLPGYVRVWGMLFILVTLAIWALKSEPADEGEGPGGPPGRPTTAWRTVVDSYEQLWQVVKLPAVWQLAALLLTYRLGVLAAESAAALKLLEKGVPKEALATLVLVQFPVEMASAVIAGRWAQQYAPHRPFLVGGALRLLAAAASTAFVYSFPEQTPETAGSFTSSDHYSLFFAIASLGLVTSFSATLMFTAIGSFFNRVSDPAMGGAYLTLLNTIANMGVTLPKTPMFWAMDAITRTACTAAPAGADPSADLSAIACPKKPKRSAEDGACPAAGGVCAVTLDGFYVVSAAGVVLGAVLWLWYCRLFVKLQKLPLERWRAPTAVRKLAQS